VTDRLGGVTTYVYDADGMLDQIMDAEGQITAYTYNARHEKTVETYPDHTPGTSPGDAGYGQIQFAYDPAGRLQWKTDQLGDTVTFAYDMANRLLQRDYRLKANSPSGPIADSDSFTYDPAGRMLTATSGRYSNTVAQTYDPLGRLETESLTIAGQTYTTTRAYDPRSQLAQLTYPDGTQVDRAYTARGQLSTVSYAGNVVDTRTYDPGGRLSTSGYGNGVMTTWTYRDDGSTKRDNMLDTIATAHPAGVTDTVGDYSYTWDANKNKTSEAITGVMSPYGFNSAAGQQPAAYDADDRLVAWNRNDGNLDQAWTLTPVGDWDLFTEEAVTQDRSHGPAHEITGVTIDTNSYSVQHDVKGNVTFIPAILRGAAVTDDMTLNWHFDNRLASADTDNGGTADVTFGYDALGRRVRKTAATMDTVFVQAGQQVIADYTAGAAPTSPREKYVYASFIDEPILKDGTLASGTGIVYYHRNQQYSVTALTDAAGSVIERYAYDPHGALTILDGSGTPLATQQSPVSNRTTYTGRELDIETHLYHFRARLYSPTLGRFLTRDPLEYVDGLSLYRAYFVPGGMDSLGLSCKQTKVVQDGDDKAPCDGKLDRNTEKMYHLCMLICKSIPIKDPTSLKAQCKKQCKRFGPKGSPLRDLCDWGCKQMDEIVDLPGAKELLCDKTCCSGKLPKGLPGDECLKEFFNSKGELKPRRKGFKSCERCCRDTYKGIDAKSLRHLSLCIRRCNMQSGGF